MFLKRIPPLKRGAVSVNHLELVRSLPFTGHLFFEVLVNPDPSREVVRVLETDGDFAVIVLQPGLPELVNHWRWRRNIPRFVQYIEVYLL